MSDLNPMQLYEVSATIVVESDDRYEAERYVASVLRTDPEFEDVRVGSARAVRRAERAT